MTIEEFKMQYALGTLSKDTLVMFTTFSNTSKEMLIILSKDSDYHIRCCVAHNCNTPIEILRKLCSDAEWHVRCAAYACIDTRKLVNDV